jgi:hypothetical protein
LVLIISELFSLAGSETQKITRSNNPPIKATLLRSRHESKKGHWNRTLCLDKLQDTGGRENHVCVGLTASRKLPACSGGFKRNSTRQEKVARAGGRKDSE